MHAPESRKRCAIPRELSVRFPQFITFSIKTQAIVHDCYQNLSDDDDQQKKWDFTVRYVDNYICYWSTYLYFRFDAPSNRHVNRELVTNILAVTEKSHDVTLIKREALQLLYFVLYMATTGLILRAKELRM